MGFQRELYWESSFLCPRRKSEVGQYFTSLNSTEENFKALWKDKSSKFRVQGRVNSAQAIQIQRQESISVFWGKALESMHGMGMINKRVLGGAGGWFCHWVTLWALNCFTEEWTQANRIGLSLQRENIPLLTTTLWDSWTPTVILKTTALPKTPISAGPFFQRKSFLLKKRASLLSWVLLYFMLVMVFSRMWWLIQNINRFYWMLAISHFWLAITGCSYYVRMNQTTYSQFVEFLCLHLNI